MAEIGAAGERRQDGSDDEGKSNDSGNGIDAKRGIERETIRDEEGVTLAPLGTTDTSATKGESVGAEAGKGGIKAQRKERGGRKGWWARMNASAEGEALENMGSHDGLLAPGGERGQTGEVVWKVYKRRWFGLLQLVLLNIVVSWDVSYIVALWRLRRHKLTRP
jgi:hypothetical protein